MSDIDEARERERFEIEMRPHLAPQHKNLARWGDTGAYVRVEMQRAWEGWLAAKRDAAFQAAQREDAERLDWLTSNPGMELDWGEPDGGDEGDSYVWRVHQQRGSRNDREWRFLGQGETPRAAIDAARAAEGGGR